MERIIHRVVHTILATREGQVQRGNSGVLPHVTRLHPSPQTYIRCCQVRAHRVFMQAHLRHHYTPHPRTAMNAVWSLPEPRRPRKGTGGLLFSNGFLRSQKSYTESAHHTTPHHTSSIPTPHQQHAHTRTRRWKTKGGGGGGRCKFQRSLSRRLHVLVDVHPPPRQTHPQCYAPPGSESAFTHSDSRVAATPASPGPAQVGWGTACAAR